MEQDFTSSLSDNFPNIQYIFCNYRLECETTSVFFDQRYTITVKIN